MRATTLATIVLAAVTSVGVAGPAGAADARLTTDKACKGETTAKPAGKATAKLVDKGVSHAPGGLQHYTWKVEGDGGGYAATISLKGFDANGKETWYSAGNWFSNQSGAADVPWGEVLARPGLRAVGDLPLPVKFTGC